MPNRKLTLRMAVLDDAEAIAKVFSPSYRLLTFLPELHTIGEDRWFIENIILKECEVTVAERCGTIVSFLARQDEEVRLLYSHPEAIGKGAGSLLLEAAKISPDIAALELWCFEANTHARRFYEVHGFGPIEFTDGQRNEEKTPDVRYRWERSWGLRTFTVTIAPIDRFNWREALDVRVSTEQLRFVADHQPIALVILSKAYVQPGDLEWFPLALVCEGSLIGVAALAYSTARAECGLYHFAIDASRQGQGLGRRALNAVVDHLAGTFPHCERLLVTVHPANRIARHLYDSSGFRPTGESRDGEAVLAKDLRRGTE